MILTRIDVKGAGKETATIHLKAGLNVIAGASNTGKSYIVECIQFILGAKKVPKRIKQSIGYTSLEVTFEDDDGTIFVLARELKSGADITCTEIDKDNLKQVLKPRHSGKNNLSDFILKKINLNERIIVKGIESLNHISLTLRVLEKIILADEARIISTSSPLGNAQNSEKTQELALFRTLITGLDDAEIKNLKAKSKSKASLSNEILRLQEFLERFLKVDHEIKKDDLDYTLEKLENSYEKVEKELHELISSNADLMKCRNETLSFLVELNKKKVDNDALVVRFNQLKDKYISDRERLEANSESAFYLNKQEELNCPICGSDVSHDNDFDISRILISNKAEVIKIDEKANDLEELIYEIFLENRKIESEIKKLNLGLDDIDYKLKSDIAHKLRDSNKLLKKIGVEKGVYRSRKETLDRREKVISEIGRLQIDHDAISDKYQVPDFDIETKEFEKIVSKILVRWGFPDGREVRFDKKSRDIVIGSSPRDHFGKGMRAICFSAFLLGLMIKLKGLKNHPGFLVLDSPLTSYKEGDVLEEGDEKVIDLAYAFYEDLCVNYKDSQIILLDNREPEENLHKKMNYIHFSKNEKIGRYGFFPLENNL